MALKPPPIGLIGLTNADLSASDEGPLGPPPPPRSRFAKFALALLVPIGLAFAAHRVSTPEGLDGDEPVDPPMPAAASAPIEDASLPIESRRPPSRAFARGAFGYSNAVRVRIVRPNQPITLPVEFGGSTEGMRSQWIAFDGKTNESEMAWSQGGIVIAPGKPGAYWLVIARGTVADTIGELALFVEHPMPNRMATGINGYHLGRWPKASEGAVPPGFIEVTERIADFPLSPHLRLSDFIVHDNQRGFPKYLHVREQLLDKLELIIAEIAAMRGVPPSAIRLNVVSGFRSPSHNGVLSGAAQDSRHMYGDAADIGIDVNGDGKLTELDARLVASAGEMVERKYPDLVGGIGLYFTFDGDGWPYVHIDVRGTRARWRGGAKRGSKVDSLPPGASFDSVPLMRQAIPGVPAPALPKRDSAGSAPAAPVVPPPAAVTPAAPTPAAQTPAPVVRPVARSAVRTSRSMITAITPTRTVSAIAGRPTARPSRTTSASNPSGRTSGTKKTAKQRPAPRPPLAERSAAARNRSAVTPAAAPVVRSAEDPFSAAARKFRNGRP